MSQLPAAEAAGLKEHDRTLIVQSCTPTYPDTADSLICRSR